MKVLILILMAIAGSAAVFSWVQPINSILTRLILVGSSLLFVAGILALVWKKRTLLWVVLGVIACSILLVSLPMFTPNKASIRRHYIKALTNYNGTPYVWGGEGRGGIDCSGLPRKALQDALWREGVSTFNGGLIREAIRQWWHDASASALANGYRGYMHPVLLEGNLREMPFDGLRPGDVAITKSGIHCLVYLGDERWIQADPGDGAVAIYDARSSGNSWFDTPVAIYRWTVLN